MDKKRVILVVAVLFSMAGLILAQAPAPAPAQKPPAAIVYIPVGVTGPKGAVAGLKKENFVLLEDGIEQTITGFYEPNSRIDIDIILALRALQKGRSDTNSIKVREAVENFRQQGNSQNKYTVEEMPFGANGLYDAIDRHITRLVNASIANRKALVVITDGFESSGGEPVKALQEYARKFDVAVYIFFAVDASGGTGGPSDDILEVARGDRIYLSAGTGYEDLTKMTGGSMVQAEIDTQLPAMMQEFGKNLKSQYVLGFRSTNDARDDKWRKLEVKIKAPEPVEGVAAKDMKTKVRDRYFVAKVK
jgi:Ca-activated chloride channel family protein